MPDSQYTQKRRAQFHGPTTSDDYNRRIEENYSDLVVLNNRARLLEVENSEMYRRIAKDQDGLQKKLASLKERIETLEAGTTRFTFFSSDQITYDFPGAESTWTIDEDQRVEFNPVYGNVTMSRSVAGSLSKLKFTGVDGKEAIPPGLETRVVGTSGTADNQTNQIDTSDPKFALFNKAGLVWERNVIANSQDSDGAELTLYIKMPTDLFTTARANCINISPFPIYGTTIRSIEYSTTPDPLLTESDNYTAINSSAHYEGDSDAVGWVVPGGWSESASTSDEMVDAGVRQFIFPPQDITALKIVLHQPHWYREGTKYIYSYGLSHLDLRFNKYNNFDEGSSGYILFEAPDGETISSIDSVDPEIYNVSPANIDNHFEYEVLWETSPGSGIPTNVSPGPSERVWIKFTLKDADGWSPSLTGLIVDYS